MNPETSNLKKATIEKIGKYELLRMYKLSNYKQLKKWFVKAGLDYKLGDYFFTPKEVVEIFAKLGPAPRDQRGREVDHWIEVTMQTL